MRSKVAQLFPFLALAAAVVCQAGPPAAELEQTRRDASAAVQAGDFDKAAAGFRKLTEANAKDAAAWHMLGYSLHAAGKLDEALPVHQKAATFPAVAATATYNIACVHALKGRKDEAFTALDTAVGLGFDDAKQLAADTDLASLHADPRFAKLQETVTVKAAAAPAQAFVVTTERRSARVLWFDRSGSPGQIALDYSPVPWSDDYERAITGGEMAGQKWRFGGDFWTTLDTSVALQFGKVEVAPGYYYLTLEQRSKDSYVLALHDPAAVRKQKLDASSAGKLKGGIEVPLTHEKAEESAKHLDVAIATTTSSTEGALTIRFGGHQLSSPVTMRLE